MPQSDSTTRPVPAAQAGRQTGTVRLVNAVFYGHHGVMQEEHQIGGRYEVDDLSETVNYEEVYGFVKDLVTENNFYLIEKLAYLIAHRVVEAYPDVEAVEVTVRKPNPPVGGPCDRAEAVYRIDNSGDDRSDD